MKNSRSIYFLSLILLLIFFVSCEDVIELDLDNANAKIVIEANVTNVLEPQIIKISKTKSFKEENSFLAVNGASVKVQEENGPSYSFVESGGGNYLSIPFKGTPGKKYTVTVMVSNQTYTAQSIMPPLVKLDSLTVTEISFFGNTNKFVQVNYKDIPNIPNQYNFVISVNNKLRNGYFPESDRFNDGSEVKNTLFTSEPDLKKGDKVTVDFQCIDLAIYRYFFAITQIGGNGGPPTSPANPDSNFNNAALGYFSAHTSQKLTISIP